MPETFTMSIPPPSEWEQFAPGAFDSVVGRNIRIRDERIREWVWGTVKSAQIADEGGAYHLTVEVPDGQLPFPALPPGAVYKLTDWYDIKF